MKMTTKTKKTPKTADKAKTHKVGAAKKAIGAIKPSGQGKDTKEKAVQIYCLIDPRNAAIRYIGKANDAAARFKSHMSETRRKTPLYCWIAKLRTDGLVPAMRVMAECAQSNWQEFERAAIARARAEGVRLLNIADGGDQPYCSISVRAANGKVTAQRRVETPFKRRVYEAKHKLGILLRQGYVGESARAKMRAAAIKRPDLFGAWATL